MCSIGTTCPCRSRFTGASPARPCPGRSARAARRCSRRSAGASRRDPPASCPIEPLSAASSTTRSASCAVAGAARGTGTISARPPAPAHCITSTPISSAQSSPISRPGSITSGPTTFRCAASARETGAPRSSRHAAERKPRRMPGHARARLDVLAKRLEVSRACLSSRLLGRRYRPRAAACTSRRRRLVRAAAPRLLRPADVTSRACRSR